MCKIKPLKNRYGRLLIIKELAPKTFPSGTTKRVVLTKCDCGNKFTVFLSSLKCGGTKSCGCLKKDASQMANTTHGMTKTPFYSKWRGMRRRCYKKDDKDYPQYGGRGIRISWKTFEEFKKDMYKAYLKHVEKHGTRNTTIDRIDNNKGYSKENCRWATVFQQNRNRKCSLMLKLKGVSRSLADWAKYLGINEFTIKTRMRKNWPTHMVLSTTKFSTGRPKGVYAKN